MIKWLLLLLLVPLTISSLTFYFLFSDDQAFRIVKVYTLISAILLTLLPLLFCLYYYLEEKRYGQFSCNVNPLLILILFLSFSWSCFTLGVFYSFADTFPSLCSYGGFTLFYSVLFSLFLFGAFFLVLLVCAYDDTVYKIIITSFIIPLVTIDLGIVLGTGSVFKDYSFYSYNMLTATCGTLLALMMGSLVHNLAYGYITTKKQLIQVVIYETIGGIGFPLLPASVLFNFILILLRENLFSGDTYSFACLAITNTYLLGIAGLAGMSFHNAMDVSQITSQPSSSAQLIVLSILFQKIVHSLVLMGYFLFSEEQLPLYAVLGACFALIFQLTDMLLQLYLYFSVCNLGQNGNAKTTKIIPILQGILLFVGVVVESVLLGMAQKESNVFYSLPQFCLFALLSIFSLAHTGYAVLPSQAARLDYLNYMNLQNNDQSIESNSIIAAVVSHLQNDINIESLIEEVQDEDKLKTLVDQQCAICLSGMWRGTFFEQNGIDQEVSRLKKCGHYFHKQCILDWLTSQRNCPLDRQAA